MFLQRRERLQRYTMRESNTTLVIDNEATEGHEPLKESFIGGVLVEHLDVPLPDPDT